MTLSVETIRTTLVRDNPYESLDRLLSKTAPEALPAFLESVRAQPLHWDDGTPMTESAWRHFVVALTEEDRDVAGQLVRNVRPHLRDLDCYKLCRRLVDAANGTPRRWPMFILAVVGSPYQIEILGRDLNEVAEKSDDVELIADMVEILRREGSSRAVRWLDHWTTQSAIDYVRVECREALQILARERSTSIEDLVESALPRFGFDDNGEAEVDYGSRSVIVRLVPTGGFEYEDESGKVLKNIPGKRKGDDRNAVKEGRKRIRELRREVKAAIQTQVERLEDAMGFGRAWPVNLWRDRFMRHPLMQGISQRLVFVYHPHSGSPVPFTPMVDGRLIDEDGREVHMTASGTVKLLHPANLEATAIRKWRKLMKTKGKLGKQPFKQLSRKTFAGKGQEAWEPLLGKLGTPSAKDVRKRRKKLGYRKKSGGADGTTINRKFGPYTVLVDHVPVTTDSVNVEEPVKLDSIKVLRDREEVAPCDLPNEVLSEVLRELHKIFKGPAGGVNGR